MPGQLHDLPAMMRVVGHVVGQVLRRIMGESDDAAAMRERRADDAHGGPAFCAEGARRLRRCDARASELARDVPASSIRYEVFGPDLWASQMPGEPIQS